MRNVSIHVIPEPSKTEIIKAKEKLQEQIKQTDRDEQDFCESGK